MQASPNLRISTVVFENYLKAKKGKCGLNICITIICYMNIENTQQIWENKKNTDCETFSQIISQKLAKILKPIRRIMCFYNNVTKM